eukprot:CAMPEP_0167777468 /NCGR_PEP_ID=MMETSP0111_2-20121227/3720_1 /TAXON_ID=91324 /ORGANISM="Lotharella globosa, Strain CCCM811" /LENGTH=205 /DNA_ID=CAMNT_0007667675 /DNA_START=19 /DNA_END=633 /DNA_ORIENTATION=-
MTGGFSFVASLGLYLAYRATHKRYWVFGSVTLKSIAEAVNAAAGTLVAVEGIIMSPHSLVFSWQQDILISNNVARQTETPTNMHPLELAAPSSGREVPCEGPAVKLRVVGLSSSMRERLCDVVNMETRVSILDREPFEYVGSITRGLPVGTKVTAVGEIQRFRDNHDRVVTAVGRPRSTSSPYMVCRGSYEELKDSFYKRPVCKW